MGEIRKYSCFTWERQEDQSGCEVWRLSSVKDIEGFTQFALKNYGGEPNDKSAFSGWRIVSGGPFTAAGGWTNIEDALTDVTPWLVDRYRKEAEMLKAKLGRLIAAIDEFDSVLSA